MGSSETGFVGMVFEVESVPVEKRHACWAAVIRRRGGCDADGVR